MGNAGSIDASKEEEVDLSGKGLKKITFRNLDNARIVKLGLYNNQLTSLPVEIGRLNGLKWLDLGSNQLTSLPVEFGMLTCLKELDLSNNPLTTPPMEVCNEGITAIRAYFLEHPTESKSDCKSDAKTMHLIPPYLARSLWCVQYLPSVYYVEVL